MGLIPQAIDSPRTTNHFGVQKHFDTAGIRLAIVQTEDPGKDVDWHCHENPHLTFILRGHVIEGTRKQVYHCSPGELLFHSRFEPHYNSKLAGSATCLHIDFDQQYLDDFSPQRNNKLEGVVSIRNSGIKFSCYKLIRETMISDDFSAASIQGLSWQVLGQLISSEQAGRTLRPRWVNRLEEMLQEEYSEKLSLDELSGKLNIHPVHLSRSFSRYFQCTLGEYVRNIRVERSLALMSRRNISLTEIATACGFADQSHFTRSFKQKMGVTPSTYRKLFSQ